MSAGAGVVGFVSGAGVPGVSEVPDAGVPDAGVSEVPDAGVSAGVLGVSAGVLGVSAGMAPVTTESTVSLADGVSGALGVSALATA
jgi:hypothetical protein